MVFAAAPPAMVRIWLALSLVDVQPIDPLAASDAVNPRPAAVNAALKASIELTWPAATVLVTVMVVAAPVAGVKMKVLPVSEFVPPMVRSAAVPTSPAAGAKLVTEALAE